uniref:Autophagy-related protein 18b-like isoform X2 n=1 Tax=Rhizophora mucronata TaxID=61149 RepID=A0A2P2JFX9_RHIMU
MYPSKTTSSPVDNIGQGQQPVAGAMCSFLLGGLVASQSGCSFVNSRIYNVALVWPYMQNLYLNACHKKVPLV